MADTESEAEMDNTARSEEQDAAFRKCLWSMYETKLDGVKTDLKTFNAGNLASYNELVESLKHEQTEELREAEFYHACEIQEIEEEFKQTLKRVDLECREKIAQCKAQMEADLKRQLEMLGDDDVSDAAAKAELTSTNAVKRTMRTRWDGKKRGGRRGKEEDPILRKKKRKATAGSGPPIMRLGPDLSLLKDWEINDDVRLFTNKGSVRQRRAPVHME